MANSSWDLLMRTISHDLLSLGTAWYTSWEYKYIAMARNWSTKRSEQPGTSLVNK